MNKKGFVTIEAIMVCSFAMILVFFFISIFTYIYPAISIQRDVYALGRLAQRNGGLTRRNVREFKDNIEKYNFVKKTKKPVIVKAYTSSGYNALNIERHGYISRRSNEIINVIVKVPSNSFLSKTSEKNKGYYVFKTSVLSERY